MENFSGHYTIPLLGTQWWTGIVISILFIALPLIWIKNKDAGRVQIAGKILGAFLILLSSSIHFYLWYNGHWDLQTSLPLQLCALSSILSGLIFFFPQNILLELLVFWGIPGAVHSIITPEMSHGYSGFLYAEYYLSHAGIILAAFYALYLMNKSVRKWSWFRVFLITQVVLIVVALFNYFYQANYMYLCVKPIAENPFIIGEWPWYLIGLEFAGLLHFYLLYFILKKTGKVA
ncbi:MAG: TIGR02206 family membrane protein [Bacteroidetes bacterium]|nr:TIGR02206 family membrane protein [Bacteroidota bacterium]